MDLGAVGFGGWGVVGSDPGDKQSLYGHAAALGKQSRPAPFDASEDDLRSSKLAKTDDNFLSASDKAGKDGAGAPARSIGSSPVFFSGGNQEPHMLCFSSSKSDALPPHLSHSSSYLYGKHSGADLNGALLSRGPFTPSQYMELEHQALIYKYIVSNVPVPSNLLIPIKKAFESAVLACQSGGLFRPNSLGWGSFHLGLSRSADPEQGRCRRTDGKKWRCSKEAVPDQKYCEKHLNRGRHRSRKPVEGQTGRPVSATTTTTTFSSTSSALVGPGSGISDSMTLNRMFMDEENFRGRLKDSASPYLLSPTLHLKPKENHSVHQFITDWPENPSNTTNPTVPGPELYLQPDVTQLSIAIPASSPEYKKACSIQSSYWVPVSWETSMGGPLGEALKSTNSGPVACHVSTSPLFQSSPTGVIQRTSFVSHSNSSAGSSPRADN